MTYKEWMDYAVIEYDLISKNYNFKIYENMVKNPATGNMDLIQMTLREVLVKCDGTNYEHHMRCAIMKCVYTGAKLEREIKKVMDPFFGA